MQSINTRYLARSGLPLKQVPTCPMSSFSMADLKTLEHPTLKVPYEILNKKFRSGQKVIDREMSHVNSAVNELDAVLQSKPVRADDVARLLGGVVEKLGVFKRKACEGIQEELDAAKVIKRRLDHLKESDAKTPAALSQWCHTRLDRMLVEYFLRSGYYNAAVKLAEDANVTDCTNIDVFLVAREVEDSLKKKETAKALLWCHDNRSRLRKMSSSFEFNLRTQELIELIRQKQNMEAIRHARKYCSNMGAEHLSELQKVMGLMAFSGDVTEERYAELLDEDRWQKLIAQFRQDNYKLYQLNNYSIFAAALQAGLSVLKTPQCYKVEGDVRVAECPVCCRVFSDLAKPLPYAHCSRSRLVCYISGKAINENNRPLMLPNGFVYGKNSLDAVAERNDGRIVCPRTQEDYGTKDLEKVFVM